uniref:Secreted protein n=1 Tax=Anguilla anguilla TaxID=7936 RepID=A0A0E9WZ48_ANGAN
MCWWPWIQWKFALELILVIPVKHLHSEGSDMSVQTAALTFAICLQYCECVCVCVCVSVREGGAGPGVF